LLRSVGWALVILPAGAVVLGLLGVAVGALTGADGGDGGTGEALAWVAVLSLNSLLPVGLGVWILIATRHHEPVDGDRMPFRRSARELLGWLMVIPPLVVGAVTVVGRITSASGGLALDVVPTVSLLVLLAAG
jgi:hypothetical protein